MKEEKLSSSEQDASQKNVVIGKEGLWGFVFGVTAFIAVVSFLRKTNPQFGVNSEIGFSYLFTSQITAFFLITLLLLTVARLFCDKGTDGRWEISDQRRWVRGVTFILGTLFLSLFGWLTALAVALWMSTHGR